MERSSVRGIQQELCLRYAFVGLLQNCIDGFVYDAEYNELLSNRYMCCLIT